MSLMFSSIEVLGSKTTQTYTNGCQIVDAS